MAQVAELLKKHIGQWGNIYVKGSFANAVGGKVTKVLEEYVELEQEEGLMAYVLLDRIIYITFPKQH
jgi:hypothetical protein